LREFEWQALLDLKQWGRELSDRVNKLELAVEHKEHGLQYLQEKLENLEKKDEQKETDWKGLCLGYKRITEDRGKRIAKLEAAMNRASTLCYEMAGDKTSWDMRKILMEALED